MQSESAVALVVDDNDVVRLQLTRALTNEGIACDSAVNGEDAMRKFAEHHYSLVITDMRMPKVHGHALAVRLLDTPLPPRIVAVTAVTDKRLVKELKARGVDEVLHKPLNYYVLARTAKRLLDEEESRQEGQNEPLMRDATTQALKPSQTTRKDGGREAHSQSRCEIAWMQLALDYIDWRRLPNPMSVVHDLARTRQNPEPAPSPTIVEEIAIVVGVGSMCEPIGVPFKVMMQTLSTERIKMFHTSSVNFSRAVVMWRSRHGGRAMAILNDLQQNERIGGWEVVGTIARDSKALSESGIGA